MDDHFQFLPPGGCRRRGTVTQVRLPDEGLGLGVDPAPPRGDPATVVSLARGGAAVAGQSSQGYRSIAHAPGATATRALDHPAIRNAWSRAGSLGDRAAKEPGA